MTTKTFEEFMSKIDSMKIEEALKNSEKLIEALEGCGIRCVKAEGYISQPIITGQYPRKNYRITTKESDSEWNYLKDIQQMKTRFCSWE